MAMTQSPTRSLSESPRGIGRSLSFALTLDQGDVRRRIGAEDARRQDLAVGEPDLDLLSAGHDVVVGQDLAVVGDDEPGAARHLLVLLRGTRLRRAEEETEGIPLAEGRHPSSPSHNLRRGDRDDGGQRALRDVGERRNGQRRTGRCSGSHVALRGGEARRHLQRAGQHGSRDDRRHDGGEQSDWPHAVTREATLR